MAFVFGKLPHQMALPMPTLPKAKPYTWLLFVQDSLVIGAFAVLYLIYRETGTIPAPALPFLS